MTPILAPTTLASPASTADRIVETLAAYVDEHSGDAGGGHQRTMLLASLLVVLFDTPANEAIELAEHDAFDERVRAAGQARDEILDRVHRARLTAAEVTV